MFASGKAASASAANYIEDVFSTWLYTGNGSTQTITNGIDLSTKGGLVWRKLRSAAGDHILEDTVRGAGNYLISNATNAQANSSTLITSFNTTGFTTGAGSNANGSTYASWSFRKQPKFFDVVTWTGDGATSKTISHNLGATPGCIITKSVSYDAGVNDSWYVYHQGLTTPNNKFLRLSSTNAVGNIGSNMWNVTSTTFSVLRALELNTSGQTYVAYIFAHDAGGFGLTGTDNVISCGTFTTDGSENSTTNLGYEPQWLLLKASSGATSASQPWHIFDNMRGLTVAGQDDASLQPNNSNAESQVNRIGITSTGFTTNAFGANETFIYIAIRRGPMKVPTSGTSVFTPVTFAGDGTTNRNITGFQSVVDLALHGQRDGVYGSSNITSWDRLRGAKAELYTGLTDAEATRNGVTGFDRMNSLNVSNPTQVGEVNQSGVNEVFWGFRRAPSFFDEVCYTGTGSATTFTHNLGVAPELIIVKGRSGARAWTIYHSSLGATKYIEFNTSAAFVSSTRWNDTAPTSSVFTVGTAAGTNVSTETYVAYLFATCAGVSKVGSYTGTGTTLQVNCGFTGGARFILIKRTDTTGDWYVWDTARGIVSGNDPYLLLNSTATEVTTTDYIDPYSAGFEISSTAPAAINASGGTYIYLAIA